MTNDERKRKEAVRKALQKGVSKKVVEDTSGQAMIYATKKAAAKNVISKKTSVKGAPAKQASSRKATAEKAPAKEVVPRDAPVKEAVAKQI